MRKFLIFLTLTLLPTSPVFAEDTLEKKKALELINSTVLIDLDGQGSGVVIYSKIDAKDKRIKKTYILTNEHVAEKVGEACKVNKFIFLKKRNTVGKRQYYAKTVMISKEHDIGLIEIETPPNENFTPVEICPESKWDEMTLYDKVYLVSCGKGTVPCVTKGTLSWVNKDETEMGFTANIIYGSSGGGLYNTDGQLIGVGNAVKLSSGHPITHKALGIPLTAFLKDIRGSDYSFILDEYDEAAEEEEDDDWEPDWDEEEESEQPEAPKPEAPKVTPKTPKKWF